MNDAKMTRPLAYFDRNGGDYPWFLRETDGAESTYATLGEAVAAGLNACAGVDVLTRGQSEAREAS